MLLYLVLTTTVREDTMIAIREFKQHHQATPPARDLGGT